MTIGIFGALLLIAGGWFFLRAMRSPFKGYTEPRKDIEVRHGLRTSVILKHFEAEGIIRDEYLPLVYMKIARHNDSIKAGIYEFSKPMSAEEVLDKLIRGEVVAKSVTVREGLDRFAVAHIFVQEGFGRDAEWDKLTGDPELIRDIAPEAKTLEGYLFPDTYKFNPGTPPRDIVAGMVTNFRKHFGGEMNYITTGLDLHKTVTLASIVETEARMPPERPLVASVYFNRINRNMLLGADPTVIYALKLAQRWDGNIHKADLQIDSPYNTYRFHGLPPGPIANPGLASLQAAAAPAKSDYLYFVAKHDGTHAFATNMADHDHNVQIYQIQWYRDQRAAQQAQPQTTK
ncbi:MAG: hypothetical protein QOC81_3240 [Thermoanaerobaculia bacterium]|jgi:UPF0755 protein|nr:hypothetical protein [Thermoanaerobaculia bacterium]